MEDPVTNKLKRMQRHLKFLLWAQKRSINEPVFSTFSIWTGSGCLVLSKKDIEKHIDITRKNIRKELL